MPVITTRPLPTRDEAPLTLRIPSATWCQIGQVGDHVINVLNNHAQDVHLSIYVRDLRAPVKSDLIVRVQDTNVRDVELVDELVRNYSPAQLDQLMDAVNKAFSLMILARNQAAKDN